MPIIIDNFFVNNPSPIDNRCVVGTASFYSNKDLIQYKYPGLRIWDLNDSVPYVWTGVTWSSENTVGVVVDNTTSTNYIPKFKGTTILGNSIIYETGSGLGNIGIGLLSSAILPNVLGITNNINGLHVSGNIRTNNKFIGSGSYITDINANNINSGALSIGRISTLFGVGGSTNAGLSYVLQNLGNTVEWVLSSGLSVNLSTNSANIAVTSDDTTNSTHYINFTQGFSNYQILKVSPNKLKYNPSTGTLSSTNVDLTGYINVKDYLSIGSNSLSSTLGSQVSLVKLNTNNGNNDYLDITNTRVSTLNSTDWRSAGYRIQQKVDSTYMAYIQFNGNNDGGISFGTGQTTTSATSISERFKIDQSGNFFMSGLEATTSSAGTTILVRDNTTGQLKGFNAGPIPLGGIIMWSGSVAPSGWRLCISGIGTVNGIVVPNLSDRFVVGTGNLYTSGNTGGSKDAVVVSHSHGGTTGSGGAHSHLLTTDAAQVNLTSSNTIAQAHSTGGNFGYGLVGTNTLPTVGKSSDAPSHTHTITSDGVSGTDKNLPPYYALAFIIYVGI